MANTLQNFISKVPLEKKIIHLANNWFLDTAKKLARSHEFTMTSDRRKFSYFRNMTLFFQHYKSGINIYSD